MVMSAALSLKDILARPDIWHGGLVSAEIPAMPSGFPALDEQLPGGGWPRGALSELLSDGAGFGECSLLLPVLNAVRAEGRWSVLIAPPYAPHAPAWIAGGADCARLAVVAPESPRDLLWAAEQTLSSGAAGAVLCWAKHASPGEVRRLQVAASQGDAPVFLFRPRRACTQASTAPLRLLLSPGKRGTLGVEVFKRRGPPCDQVIFLETPRPSAWRDDGDPGNRDWTCPGVLARRDDAAGARVQGVGATVPVARTNDTAGARLQGGATPPAHRGVAHAGA
jgi:cell division inhibitor SulA